MKIFKLLTLLSAILIVLSCIKPPTMQPNQDTFIYVTKNTFSGDFSAGMEIHGDNTWDGDLRDATHIVFNDTDQLGNEFPGIDTLFAQGFAGGAVFSYKLGRQPTSDFHQFTVENVVMNETAGVFRYGVRYSVRLVW